MGKTVRASDAVEEAPATPVEERPATVLATYLSVRAVQM